MCGQTSGSDATAVVLAVTYNRKWRGWMGIEPTQDASTAPANGFEDRVFDIRQRPLTSAKDEPPLAWIR